MATKKQMTSCGSAKDRFDSMLRLIPGYDPFETAGPECWFDYTEADAFLQWWSRAITHIEGRWAGQPLVLEPWQQAIFANLFGWKRKDGTRRYRHFFLMVPRKNGKTPMVAGLLLAGMAWDRERGAQIYSAAGDREQASLMFRQMKGMVLRKEQFRERMTIFETNKTILFHEPENYYRAISAEAKTKHGYNTHMAAVDELHTQPNRDLVDVLKSSMDTRAQPLMGYLTTRDFDKPSICNETEDYFFRVRDGVIEEPEALPVIYCADRDDDWTDPDVWAKANPNLGVSIKRDAFAADCKAAQDQPSYLNTFLRLRLNIKTGSNVAWIALNQWDACGSDFEFKDMRGEALYGGLDLATVRDLSAVAFVGAESRRHWVRFYCPEDTAFERENRDKVPYLTWARQGWITLTPGNVTDYEFIERDILEINQTHRIANLGVDPWNATDLIIRLQRSGVPVEIVQQNIRNLSSPAKMLERMIVSGELRHNRNPVMRWCVGNAMIEKDAQENIMPSKKKSTQRIDGVAATVTGLASLAKDEGPSVYEGRGVLVL